MFRKLLSPLVLLGVLAIAPLAHADTFGFSASGSGGGFSGSGTLTATKNADGSYTITNITGTGITGLTAPNMFNGNDNLFFPFATSLVDTKGFSFTDLIGNTGYSVDLYSNGAGKYFAFLTDSDKATQTVPVNFSITNTAATPEPSSFILLGTGVLGMLGVARRKYRRA